MERISSADVVRAAANLIDSLLESRPDLRPSVAVLARWVAEVAGAPRGVRTEQPVGSEAVEAIPPDEAAPPEGDIREIEASVEAPEQPAAPSPAQPEAFVPLRLGDTQIQVKVPGSSQEIGRARVAAFEAAQGEATEKPSAYADLDEPDLDLIARRCELKVRACRVVRDLQHSTGEAAYALRGEVVNELIPQAKQMNNCFLWMTMPNAPYPGDHAMELCRDAYANVGAAAQLLARVTAGGSSVQAVQQALEVAAEAQSSLRVALRASWLTRDDFDQYDMFIWIRRFTERNQYYIERFLRVDDPGDPTHAADVAARIASASGAAEKVNQKARELKSALSRARYHAKQIADNPGEVRPSDWKTVMESLAAARGLGAPAHDSRVREVANLLSGLTPPEGVSVNPLLVKAERPAEARPDEEPDAPAAAREYSVNLRRVAEVLRGRRIVVSGGEERPHQMQNLKEAFGLEEVAWVTIKEHASAAPLEGPIRDPRTFMVLSLVRLSSHAHVDAAKEYARQYGRHYVMIPAGFSPEQVAEKVIEQRGVALGLSGSPA